jgi:transmembrane sensor
MSPPATVPETIEAQAAGWFARQRSGLMTADETAELDTWLAAAPAHQEAFDAVGRAFAGVAFARSAPEILAIRAEARKRPQVQRRVFAARIAAGFMALAVVGGTSLWAGKESGIALSRGLTDQTFSTTLGERSTFTLPDGSVVTLDTASRLRTKADGERRLLYLESGRAYFRVAKDRRHPFVVAAAGRTITAVGTAFDVRVDGKALQVTLVEGKVKVDTPVRRASGPADAPPMQTTEMLPGARLVASLDTPALSVAPTDTAKETSWLTGWLNFENKPLSEVAAEFNRYSPRKIVLADAAIGATAVSGRFEADDVEAFTRALARYRIARVESAGADVIRLAAPDEQ